MVPFADSKKTDKTKKKINVDYSERCCVKAAKEFIKEITEEI